MPNWSDHALQRIRERFSEFSIPHLEAILERSRRPTKKQRKQIKLSCSQAAKKWMRNGFAGRYCMINRSGIVFVIEAPNTIVTLFRLEEGYDRTNQASS